MNKYRRKALSEINDRLWDILNDLEELLAKEEEVRDNIPENLQNSERYEQAKTLVRNSKKQSAALKMQCPALKQHKNKRTPGEIRG